MVVVLARQLCVCGCGKLTSGKWNYKAKRSVKYCHGHNPTQDPKTKPLKLVLCACGCGEMTSGKWNSHTQQYVRFVWGHSSWGRKHTIEARAKISAANKGRPVGEKAKRNITIAAVKRWASEEERETFRGPNNPMYGRSPSVATRKKISIALKGRFLGENHSNWRGGISFEPYGSEFNDILKLRIRQRDNFTCQFWGRTEEELDCTLHVHHIDYDKRNNSEDNLICLCQSCHSKTQRNRAFWQAFFELRSSYARGI